MRKCVAVVFFLSALAARGGELDERAARANTARDLEAVARDAEDRRAGPEVARSIARAWLRLGDPDRALAALERAPDRLLEAEAWLAKREEGRALEVLEKAPEDDARRRLAALRERRAEWRQALAAWEGVAAGTDRTLGLARCRFQLGEKDRALDETAALIGKAYDPAAVLQLVELAARAGRLAFAREKLGPVDDPRRDVALAIGAAFAERSGAGLLRAVRPLDPEKAVGPEWRVAARLLVEVAAADLETAIGEGDAHAIALAGASGDARFVQTLERRLPRERGETARIIKEALERLRAAR